MIGNGCKVGYSEASPVSWTRINNIVDLGFPLGEKASRVDKTVHSTTQRRKRYEPGLLDVDDPFFTVILDDTYPALHATLVALRTLKAARTLVWFRFEKPENDACTTFVGWEFQARVADVQMATPLDGQQTMRFGLMFDGTDIGEDPAPGASEIA